MYNTTPVFQHEKFDEFFLRAVLIETFRKPDIETNNVNDERMDFARALYSFHVKSEERIANFQTLSKKLLRTLREKYINVQNGKQPKFY